MQIDVADLRDFYAAPLGQAVRRLLTHRIRARWRRLDGMTVMGLGFATPFLGNMRAEARRVLALMPSAQGALAWPCEDARLTALVDEERLPLADNSVDRLLAVHCLEAAARDRQLLREIWRVLAPEGRLMMVVPNRRGVWARIDNTPFGHGRPYSRRQLGTLLTEALLTPVDWGGALYIPPLDRRVVLRSAPALERMGARVTPAFSGVILVEARKEVSSLVGRGTPARVRTAPVLPAGARRTSDGA
jgi:SAM-dependent methyltransferase